MVFRQALNDWLSIIIKIAVIGVVIVGIFYLCISGYGNWKLNKMNAPPPDPPDITTGYDEVTLTATNQKYYTESCDLISSVPFEVYRVNGYYELVRNKWTYRDIVIILDEEYYGNIIVRRK